MRFTLLPASLLLLGAGCALPPAAPVAATPSAQALAPDDVDAKKDKVTDEDLALVLADIAALQASVADLQATVVTLETDLAAAQAENAAQDETIAELEFVASVQTAALDALRADHEALEIAHGGRLAALESAGYATEGWVLGRGYALDADLAATTSTLGLLSAEVAALDSVYARDADLADYASRSELELLLAGFEAEFVTFQDLDAELLPYVTTASLGEELTPYVTGDALEAQLLAYLTADDLAGYLTSDALAAALLPYVSADALDARLLGYLTGGDLDTRLLSYVSTDDLDARLLTYVSDETLTLALSGYATASDVTSQVGALDLRLDILELTHPRVVDLLRYVSADLSRDAVVFSGVNVYIQSGMGATNGDPAAPFDPASGETNGLGNLIIGYDEASDVFVEGFPLPTTKTGSHNLVIGPFHSYGSYGGVVAGFANGGLAPYASVLGGTVNYAEGEMSAILGGSENLAAGLTSAVGGGAFNYAEGEDSVVAGGHLNYALGSFSAALGGEDNVSDAFGSVTVGGQSNLVTGNYGALLGGHDQLVADLFGIYPEDPYMAADAAAAEGLAFE